MRKILVIFLFFFLSTFILSGCINTKTGDINVDQAQKVQEAINDYSKILSAQEYQELIDVEIAKLARERLLSTSTESLSESTVLELGNELERIKNNCNLKLDDSIILSDYLKNRFSQGYICKYIKGSATPSQQRVDEFSIKYINTQPFEFGVSGSLEERTSNALVVLEDKTGNSLIEDKGEIYTIAGEIYFDDTVRTVVDNRQSPGSSSGSNNTTIISEPSANTKIFLAVLGDEGKRGQSVGCGDSLVSVGVNLNFPNNNLNDKIEFTLDYLFKINKYDYDKERGIVNPIYNSDLVIKSINISGNKAVVKIDGSLNLKGICDYPIAEAQIKQTVQQFSEINEVELIINELEEGDLF